MGHDRWKRKTLPFHPQRKCPTVLPGLSSVLEPTDSTMSGSTLRVTGRAVATARAVQSLAPGLVRMPSDGARRAMHSMHPAGVPWNPVRCILSRKAVLAARSAA